VDRVNRSIYAATPDELGQFDLVFCGSVLIHLRDPLLALERMAALCHGRLVLAEERARRLLTGRPVAEFRGLSPWMVWWIATSRTWARMAEIAGFRDARVVDQFTLRFRRQRGGVPHAVVHARGPAR
jgi:tRNA (mo5U34)-methyltransferase